MPFVQGFLKIRGGGGHIDNELPGADGPVDPGYGISIDRPDNSLPEPPGIWPPPNLGHPIVPIGPDNTLPIQPGTIWPSPGRPPHVGGGPIHPEHPGGGPMPGRPARPDQGLPPGQAAGHPGGGPMPGGERPDQGLPTPPAYPDNSLPSGLYWMLCYCPSLGWKFVCVDPSLRPGMPLPPAAQPK